MPSASIKKSGTYFLSRVYVNFSIAAFFLRGGSTFDCVTVLAGSEVVMVTREMAVTWKESLGPEPAHTVLTAGEQNITHCTSVRGDEGHRI